MVNIEPIRVQVEREEDGRALASVPELSGVLAYAATPEEAVPKVMAIALQVRADMIESGEEVPAPLKVLFAARAFGQPQKRGESTLLCFVWDGR